MSRPPQRRATPHDLADVESVELRVSVPAPDRRRVLSALGLDPVAAQISQVGFLEGPDLPLLGSGVTVTAGRGLRRPSYVAVKLWPLLTTDAPAGMRQLPGFKVEVHLGATGRTPSCALAAQVPDRRVRELVAGRLRMSELLTPAQHELLAARLPDVSLLDGLGMLGPVHVLRRTFAPEAYPHRIAAELLFLPDGSRLLDLATRCAPHELDDAVVDTTRFLTELGVVLGTTPEHETRSALAALVADRRANQHENDEETRRWR